MADELNALIDKDMIRVLDRGRRGDRGEVRARQRDGGAGLWAAAFGSAVRRSGGELVANGRIPTQAVIGGSGGVR